MKKDGRANHRVEFREAAGAGDEFLTERIKLFPDALIVGNVPARISHKSVFI